VLEVWTERSGYNFGTLQEQVSVAIDLPLVDPLPHDVTLSIISGNLPSGLRISGKQLVGSPYITSGISTHLFCVRASNGSSFSDRTFKISVDGSNPPQFITPAGELAIGPSQQLYALDSSYVTYQLEAAGLNSVNGNPLKFFIGSGDGALPPGLTMTESGLISGFIKPVLTLTEESGDGTFDDTFYDKAAYDFALVPTDGFDTYQYDDVFFDYNKPTVLPTSLNSNYQFRVTITDGIAFAQRVFRIFVIGNDDFRADSTVLDGFAGTFTADSTYIRKPSWITSSKLGTYRANNYITVPVVLYDKTDTIFRLEKTNMEVYAVSTRLNNEEGTKTVTVTAPSGSIHVGDTFTLRDYVDGAGFRIYEILGLDELSPGRYLLSISKPLEIPIPNNIPFYIGSQIVYSLSSQSFINEVNSSLVLVTNVTGPLAIGQYFTLDNYVENADETVYEINSIVDLGGDVKLLGITTPLTISITHNTAFYIGSLSALPTGTNFDVNTGEVYGNIPYQQAVMKTFVFTITATRLDPENIKESITSSRTFTINILGDLTSLIVWDTPADLGSIPANYISLLNIQATSSVSGAVVTYALSNDSGPLPSGLTLNVDGEILGMPNQFYDPTTGQLGITRFYDIVDGEKIYTTTDGDSTTFDKQYKFTVIASDQYGYSSVSRTFTLSVTTPNTVLYSNITTQPFLVPDQREIWQTFINNSNIFPPEHIYRGNDQNFGIQRNLKMLVYAGIETSVAAAYVGAMGLNHKRKRFQFDSVTSAAAIDPDTNKTVYEVVYLKMVDPLENGKLHLPSEFVAKVGLGSETITSDESLSIWSRKLSDLSLDEPDMPRPHMLITADSTGYQTSNINTNKYYPNSISNWQKRLSTVGQSERNYLPLWMRSIQSGKKEQMGYVLAVPICFCKPGTAATIIANINKNGFKFNQLDYTVDRFTISAVTGYSSDKYLVFRNDRITV
jgi:hypothetical protein